MEEIGRSTDEAAVLERAPAPPPRLHRGTGAHLLDRCSESQRVEAVRGVVVTRCEWTDVEHAASVSARRTPGISVTGQTTLDTFVRRRPTAKPPPKPTSSNAAPPRPMPTLRPV